MSSNENHGQNGKKDLLRPDKDERKGKDRLGLELEIIIENALRKPSSIAEGLDVPRGDPRPKFVLRQLGPGQSSYVRPRPRLTMEKVTNDEAEMRKFQALMEDIWKDISWAPPGAIHRIVHTVTFKGDDVEQRAAQNALNLTMQELLLKMDQDPDHYPVEGCCAVCKVETHRVPDCQITAISGYVEGCVCNSTAHLADECRIVGGWTDEKKCLILLVKRINLPPFKMKTSWLSRLLTSEAWKTIVQIMAKCHELAAGYFNHLPEMAEMPKWDVQWAHQMYPLTLQYVIEVFKPAKIAEIFDYSAPGQVYFYAPDPAYKDSDWLIKVTSDQNQVDPGEQSFVMGPKASMVSYSEKLMPTYQRTLALYKNRTAQGTAEGIMARRQHIETINRVQVAFAQWLVEKLETSRLSEMAREAPDQTASTLVADWFSLRWAEIHVRVGSLSAPAMPEEMPTGDVEM